MAVTRPGESTDGRPADGTAAAPQVAPRTRGRSCPGSGAAHGVPLATILISVAVVCTTYLAGKFIYRLATSFCS